ncbi:DgyrCDS14595 [Dimorphilus gyrociliatus]|uniref:DgyrCDS14595 n=1 Tax=Dimorphilus gyrociliatus TaxID=2664684 RepID=A0A7I8WE57_9ANNE|nr:DgyrCDS14595 [Dimorphilus gyrociliatus]
MSGLAGKIALITGASSGIGAATALLFAKHGAELALTGRNEKNLEAVVKKCQEISSRKPFYQTAELTNENDVETLIDSVIKHYKRLDILVNNAGIMEMGSIEKTTLAQYDRVMNANVRSLYQLMMLATPHLKETEGSVVNVSSVVGSRSFPNVLAYGVSKAAVDQLTRCTALELADYKVRVNAVNPGVIVTELQKRGGLDEQAYEQFLKRTKETHALGRPGQPDEVAEAIAFLASKESSSFITGATLPVDGGRHAMCPR